MNRVIDTVFDNNFAAAVLFSPAESLLLESERFRYQMAKDFTPSSRNREAFEAMTDTVGNVPPQAVELEEAVLGALMLEKDSIISVQEYVTPEAFYTEEHRLIYKAINELSMELKPIDLYTVTERLKVKKELKKVGGASYLAQLTQKVLSLIHISRRMTGSRTRRPTDRHSTIRTCRRRFRPDSMAASGRRSNRNVTT